MKAVLRLGLAVAAAGLMLGEAPALAQSAPAATTNTPAADSVGPRELQNFNLQGTVSRPAETPPPSRAPTTREVVEATAAPGSGQTAARPARTIPTGPARVESAARQDAQPSAALPFTPTVTTAPAAAAPASLPTVPVEPPASLAPEKGLALWPWLLAALALGAGGAFLFWRLSSREAYAGGPQVDEFVAPEPQPQPRAPVAQPAPPAPPQPTGFVSSRMRPWVEIGFQPTRCIVEDQQVTFEFELELFNSGNAAARDILVEANAFNASPTQDEEISAFFTNPGSGERIPAIEPLQRLSLRPHFSMPIDQVRMLEAGGRRVFVPLVALSATYGWGSGGGQTGAAYLLGRDTKAEKLAPFRLDLGPRVFRGLGARLLPVSVRS